jgi:hypothetical protein
VKRHEEEGPKDSLDDQGEAVALALAISHGCGCCFGDLWCQIIRAPKRSVT